MSERERERKRERDRQTDRRRQRDGMATFLYRKTVIPKQLTPDFSHGNLRPMIKLLKL